MRADPYLRDGSYRPDPIFCACLPVRKDGLMLRCLTEDHRLFSRVESRVWTIPRGYTFDGASIPWWARFRISADGPWLWAALLHDWLCNVGEDKDQATRAFADKLREAQDLGITEARRLTMTAAVHVGSGGAFRRAEGDWSVSFRDPRTSALVDPPFPRRAAFRNGSRGPQPWSPT